MFNDGDVFVVLRGVPKDPPGPPAPTRGPWIHLAPRSRAGCSHGCLSPSNLSGVCLEEKVSSGCHLTRGPGRLPARRRRGLHLRDSWQLLLHAGHL